MLGPENNIYLDQFLTYKIWPIIVIFVFWPEAHILSGLSNKGHF